MSKIYVLVFIFFAFISLQADGTPAEGSGTENDPFLIASLDNLLWLSTTEAVWDSIYYFLQTADIDAGETQNWNEGAGFIPIGGYHSKGPFSSSYNGSNHIIEGLCINRPHTEQIGLFGYTDGAVIEALGLTDIRVTGEDQVGGLVGYLAWKSTLSECYVTGNVTGNDDVGGLVGENFGSRISASYVEGNVTGNEFVGGVVGYNQGSLHSLSYEGGNVVGALYIGGLVGGCWWSPISESYYDYDSVLINNQHLISIGALTSELYNDWINNNKSLEITDYLSYDGENYLINDFNDFEKLLAFGQESEDSFLLTSNIDLTGHPNFFIPYFAGTFNGGNHCIDGLFVNIPEMGGIGLFGDTFEAVIEALGVTNVNVTGEVFIGGLVGFNHASKLSANYATGSVNGLRQVGGLVGRNSFNSSIKASYATVSVTGDINIGGLVGFNSDNSLISTSYATGNVTGESNVGGLVGANYEETTIRESYAIGCVAGIFNVGGLIGANYEVIESCVWNLETSGQTDGIGYDYEGTIINLIGSTTAEMLMKSTYTDICWDFIGESENGINDIWDMNVEINEGYPYIYEIEFPVSIDENVKLEIENHPNPFNPETNICFDLGIDADNLSLAVYNIKGQRVWDKHYKEIHRGKHTVVWSGEGMASGIYFYMIKADEVVRTGKMMMVK
ncbi:MAG: T9SS type A sorting domain-containing protein [Candidatus Cloacimonetes bacterium]|nr:T9SS type A sorting domain-containing protein [Candidatus Cloacimonadota bacterium]